MQKRSCLYFPDTQIPIPDIVKLLTVFSNVTYYLPCEPGNTIRITNALQKKLSEEKFLTAYPPAPLGQELERFNRIIKELTSVQYGASATSSQAITALTANSQSGGELSSDQLISSIVGRPPEYTEAEQKETEQLWSARLFLCLAEKRDEQEKDIQEGFHKISDHETSLWGSLRGGENDMKSALQKAATPFDITGLNTTTSPTLLRSRMKAWGRLFLEDTQTNKEILITSRQECLATIIDTCHSPQEIRQVSLPLPEINIADDRWFEKLTTIRETLVRRATEITETLLDKNGQCSPDDRQQIMTAWETSLKQLNQSELNNWSFLNLFCFPQSSTELLSQAFGLTATPKDTTPANCCIIGLLSSESFENRSGSIYL